MNMQQPTSLTKTPNKHIRDRAELNAMTADWVAKNGAPRRFDTGFQSDHHNLINLLESFGYRSRIGSRSEIQIATKRGKLKKVSHSEAIRLVDAKLIEAGKQPLRFGGAA